MSEQTHNGAVNETAPAELEEALAQAIEGQDGGEGAEPEGYEIEYQGKKFIVDAELKGAWDDWQGKFTRKTMEVAERERQAEARERQANETAQFMGTFQDDVAALKGLDKELEEFSKITPSQWMAARNADSKATDDALFQFNLLKQQRADLWGTLQTKANDYQGRMKAANEAQMATAAQQIAARVKDWPTQEAAVKGFIRDAYGITDAEISGSPLMRDPRVVQVLYDLYSAKGKARQAIAAAAPQAPQVVVIPQQPGRTRAAADPTPRDSDNPDVWRAKFRKIMNGKRRR